MEDYKEKYEMALEKAKKFIEENPLVQNLNTWIKEIFPELKESEDKRIKEEIIEYLERTIPHHHRDEVLKSKEWIDWLEKQGDEQKSIWTDNDKTMAFTLLRDVDQMTYISKEGKNERIGWLNSLEEKFTRNLKDK